MTTRKLLTEMSDEELADEHERLKRLMHERVFSIAQLDRQSRDPNRQGRSHLDLIEPNPGVSVFKIFMAGILTIMIGAVAVGYIIGP